MSPIIPLVAIPILLVLLLAATHLERAGTGLRGASRARALARDLEASRATHLAQEDALLVETLSTDLFTVPSFATHRQVGRHDQDAADDHQRPGVTISKKRRR